MANEFIVGSAVVTASLVNELRFGRSPSTAISGTATVTASTPGTLVSPKIIAATTPVSAALTGAIRSASLLQGTVTATASLPGDLRVASKIQGTTTVTASLLTVWKSRIFGTTAVTASTSGTLRLGRSPSTAITGSTTVRATITGTLKITTSSLSLPEDRRRTLGHRPATALLVYAVSVTAVSDLANVPENGSFLLSTLFFSDTDATLYGNGGRPNYIGTKFGGSYFFRPPLPKEIVWHINRDSQGRVSDGNFYLFNGSVWASHEPIPLRSLTGQLQYVIEQVDPSGALRYYAKLLGAASTQLGADNIDLTGLNDPDTTPPRFLAVLADTIGMDLSDLEDVQARRRRVKNTIPQHRRKGTILSAVSAIREEGFSGYVQQIWAVPMTEAEWDLLFSPTPYPVTPAHWRAIEDAPPEVVSSALSQGIYFAIRPESGLKGTVYVERPHNYENFDPTTIFPTSRVMAHINAGNGDTLDVISRQEIGRIGERLRRYSLPAHVDIREFVTDFARNDALSIADAIAFTDLGGAPVDIAEPYTVVITPGPNPTNGEFPAGWWANGIGEIMLGTHTLLENPFYDGVGKGYCRIMVDAGDHQGRVFYDDIYLRLEPRENVNGDGPGVFRWTVFMECRNAGGLGENVQSFFYSNSVAVSTTVPTLGAYGIAGVGNEIVEISTVSVAQPVSLPDRVLGPLTLQLNYNSGDHFGISNSGPLDGSFVENGTVTMVDSMRLKASHPEYPGAPIGDACWRGEVDESINEGTGTLFGQPGTYFRRRQLQLYLTQQGTLWFLSITTYTVSAFVPDDIMEAESIVAAVDLPTIALYATTASATSTAGLSFDTGRVTIA